MSMTMSLRYEVPIKNGASDQAKQNMKQRIAVRSHQLEICIAALNLPALLFAG
jgi:hypothetical protein